MWRLLFALAHAELVDRVVVVVGDTPVLQSEVELEAVLEALDRSPLPYWTSLGAGPTERLVDAVIVRLVAGDVKLYEPAPDAVAARLEAIRATFAGADAWASFLAARGLDEARLAAILRRRMVVEKYLLRTLQASPDDRDAWTAQCAAHLAQLRPRVRIREVPAPDADQSQ